MSEKVEIQPKEKEQLLNEYDRYREESTNLSLKNLVTIFGVLFLVLALFVPKIYIMTCVGA